MTTSASRDENRLTEADRLRMTHRHLGARSSDAEDVRGRACDDDDPGRLP